MHCYIFMLVFTFEIIHFNRNFLGKLNSSPISLGEKGFRTTQVRSGESSIIWLTELDNGTKAHLITKPHSQSGV